MINIQIDENYRITSDPHNIILQERRVIKEGPNAGTEEWDGIKYHSSLQQALESYSHTIVLNSAAQTIGELKDLLKTINDTINKIPKITAADLRR